MSSRILLIIDPQADTHPCIEHWAGFVARTGGELELYTCDAQPGVPEPWSTALNSHEYHGLLRERRQQMLEELARPLRARGLQVSTCSEWHAPLEEGVLRHLLESRPDLVIYDGATIRIAQALASAPAPPREL